MSEQPREVRVIEDRWSTVRHAVESLAIVAAGLWAAYVFIYQERIKPTFEPPSLQPTVTFEPGKTVSGTRVVELHTVLLNTGTVDTDVYAASASVFGDRFVAAAPKPRPSYGATESRISRMVQTSPKVLIYSEANLRKAAGGEDHIVLRPGQRVEVTLPIAVKSGQFDELHADFAIIYGRYRPGREHFARITIARGKDGVLSLRLPQHATDDDGFEDDGSVQITL